MKLPSRLNSVIDVGGLILALVVDIVLGTICYLKIAPDPITAVALVAMGITAVLFIFRSLSKRVYWAWAVFVVVVFFFDLSFILEVTRVQSTNSVTDDTELARISREITRLESSITNWQSQYESAVQRDTMNQIDQHITYDTQIKQQYEQKYEDRLRQIQSGDTVILADNIFKAIPDAWTNGRRIQLVIFGLFFLGLQAVIFVSMKDNTAVHKRASPIIITKDDIDKFVLWSWRNFATGKGKEIIDRETFMTLAKNQKKPFNERTYDKLLRTARKRAVIDRSGVILVANEQEAIRRMQ